MPITFPTRRRVHKTKLSRLNHRRQTERWCRRSVVVVSKLDFKIFEVRFAGVVGKESYVFHNVSKCDVALLLAASLPRFLCPASRFLMISLSRRRAERSLRDPSAARTSCTNGEQITDMKDIRTDTRHTVPDTSKQLPSPHFDELAVAFAQPVQPLRLRNRKRPWRFSLLLLAYLAFIVAVVGIAYMRPPGSRADTLSEAPNNETQLGVQPALNDSSAVKMEDESIATPGIRRAQAHSRRGSTRIRIQNQIIQSVEAGEGKPVPRKVGEIRYGRSSDRP